MQEEGRQIADLTPGNLKKNISLSHKTQLGLLAALAIMGFAIYLFQSVQAINTLRSPMDEGNYVYKGLLFASGQYIPYQPNGIWVNKMPLSFLIPGWVLQFFAPGLAPARYYALAVSILFIVGLFLLIRRETKLPLAVLAVWVFALNPTLIKIYAMAISQGLIACLLVWSMYFYFGKSRAPYQIGIGAFLTGIMVMTRENMIPALIFLWVYIFVRHRKSFVLAVISSLAPVLVIHVAFFPRIMINWINWVPLAGVQNFLYSLFNIVTPVVLDRYREGYGAFSRTSSFMEGIATNLWIFVAFCLVLIAIFTKKFKNQRFEIISLSILFFVFTSLHAWASLGKDNCVYCFENYLAFFNSLGIIIFSLAAAKEKLFTFKRPKVLAAILSFGIMAAVVFSSYGDMFRSGIFKWMDKNLWQFPLPRMQNFQMVGGTTHVKALLINKFAWDLEFAGNTLFPMFSLVLLLAVFFLGLWFTHYMINKKLLKSSPNQFWNHSIAVILALVLLFSPTFLIGNALFPYQCQNNVIESVNAAGQILSERIGNGAIVDWRSGQSPLLLSYLEEVKIHTPQLNGVFSFKTSNDTEVLFSHGNWNQELSLRWFMESDFLITDSQDFHIEPDVKLQDYYTQVGEAIYLYSCDGQTIQIYTFRRNR